MRRCHKTDNRHIGQGRQNRILSLSKDAVLGFAADDMI
jgi:hypothetical protein